MDIFKLPPPRPSQPAAQLRGISRHQTLQSMNSMKRTMLSPPPSPAAVTIPPPHPTLLVPRYSAGSELSFLTSNPKPKPILTRNFGLPLGNDTKAPVPSDAQATRSFFASLNHRGPKKSPIRHVTPQHQVLLQIRTRTKPCRSFRHRS